MTLRTRIRKGLSASLIGWVASLAASLPFQVIEAIRVSDSVTHRAIAILLWTLFSLAVSLYFCAFFVIPVTWMLPPALILRHTVFAIAAAGVFGVFLAAMRLHIWTARYHDGISVINFCMWASFSGAFFLATSAFYVWSLRRISAG